MKNSTMQIWLNSSYLTSSNQFYIEELYEKFLNDPNAVDTKWNIIFNNLSKTKITSLSKSFLFSKNLKKETSLKNLELTTSDVYHSSQESSQEKVYQLINAFRSYGYKHAKLDPLGMWKLNSVECLDLKFYKFTEYDLKNKFYVDFCIPNKAVKLTDLYKMLKKIYCGSIGFEYMHIDNKEQVLWIQKSVESLMEMDFNILEQKQLLNEIVQSENIEQYLHVAFPGTKRFSLEGGDVLTPMLKDIIRCATHYKIKKMVLSMAHRGRLNVLINVLNKKPKDLFLEFSDTKEKIHTHSGDVKYHQGFSSIVTIGDRCIDVSLLPNPSHLEIISPVAMGFTRAYIDSLNNDYEDKKDVVLPITIHGDAAISGQGIVQETLNMSEIPAYTVGGTVRIVINNQIGFTTSNFHYLRSSQYCTDIGKTFQIPVFHVNADDPEKVIFVARTALAFRNTFKRDVLIDLVCYRRHGHNEVDDPSVTQPSMYKKIHQHPTLCKIYSNYLKSKGIITGHDISKMINDFQNFLSNEKLKCENVLNSITSHTFSSQKHIKHNQQQCIRIKDEYLQNLACSINNLPKHFKIHPRVSKIYQERMKMAKKEKFFDWGAAEILSYATLLDQGISIRLSGEDTSRGTFFHRHTVIYNQDGEDFYVPLANINKNQGSFFIWDSVLSEEAALSFEYGYSVYSSSKTLVIWEAQFGDFANGAQIVIDQFISSGEQKWGQICSLVMLLPHGYEGQGPEHSSSRIERYLQLCAENNMKVCVPSTPSQMYHLLRYQALSENYKPLIIITPKSLLRNSMVKASLHELTHGNFQTIIEEIDNNITHENVKRVLICSGKIYYDLIEHRQKKEKYDTAIIRVEQLYPFPTREMCKIFHTYSHVKHFFWCQEEPKNQGAWYYSKNYICKIIPDGSRLHYTGRPDCAAPATGYFSLHQKQQKILLDNALDVN